MLEQLLKKAGVETTPDQLATLSEAYQKEQEKSEELLRVKLEKELDLNGIKQQHDVFEKQAKRKISRVAQMGLSNSQAEALEWDELVSQAEATVKAKIEENVKATDESLTKQINEYKEKVSQLTEKLNEREETLKSEIEKVKHEYDSILTKKEIELIAKRKSAETNWFVKESAEKFTQVVLNDITSNYKINTDGTITAKDGSKAMSPDEGKVWKTIDDAWGYFATPFVSVSNPGGGEPAPKKELPTNLDPRVLRQLEASKHIS